MENKNSMMKQQEAFKCTTYADMDTSAVQIESIKKLECTWREVYQVKLSDVREYFPGDAVGIYAPNSDKIVDKFMNILNLQNSYCKLERKGRFPICFRGMLRDFIKYKLDMTSLPRKALLLEISKNASKSLEFLCSPNGYKEYFGFSKKMLTLVDILEEYECKSASFESIFEHCEVIKPRYYSIVSKNNENTEIIVGVVAKEIDGLIKLGHVSGMLVNLYKSGVIGWKIEICFRRNKLMSGLDSSKRIVSFCTGTGIAPFISLYNHSNDKQNLVLVYGYRNPEDDLTRYYNLSSMIYRAESSKGENVCSYINLLGNLPKGTQVFICGNMKMQKSIFEAIKNAYPDIVNERRVFFDNWQ